MGFPLSQTELDPRSSPVARDSEPGVPMPTFTVPGAMPSARSASATSAPIAASVAA